MYIGKDVRHEKWLLFLYHHVSAISIVVKVFLGKFHNACFASRGLRMKTYLFEYNHKGRKKGFDVVAESTADAWQQVGNMQYGKCVGILYKRIPAGPMNFSGVFVRLFCWWGNLKLKWQWRN